MVEPPPPTQVLGGAPPLVQHPEWPGAVPSKWMDAASNKVCSREIVETNVRNGVNGVARLGLGGYMDDRHRPPHPSNAMGEGEGRRHYADDDNYYSGKRPEASWRPHAARIEQISGYDRVDPPEGLKRIEPCENAPFMRRERRHIRQVASKQETSDLPQGKTIVTYDAVLDGYDHTVKMRCHDKVAQETTLENMMTRKRNQPKSLIDMRNGIGVKALGDKYYKAPEYSDRFYHSSNYNPSGSYPRTIARNSTGWKEFEAERPGAWKRKSYKELQAEETQKLTEESVAELVEWERTNLKESVPDYEEPSDTDDEKGPEAAEE